MNPTAIFDGHGTSGHRAGLILARGVSACGAWVFSACDAGTTITVGAASTCDWQIASPGVSPLFLSFTGEALLVRPLAHDVRARVNGQTLPPRGWVQLAHGDELTIGSSLLCVQLAPALRGGQSKRSRTRQKQPKANSRAHSRTGAPAQGLQLALRDAFPVDTPSLFQDRDIRERSEPRLWYAAIALGTLLTYAVWLALLDQF